MNFENFLKNQNELELGTSRSLLYLVNRRSRVRIPLKTTFFSYCVQLFWIFTGHYFLNNALVIDDLLCSEQRWKKRANHVCQKWDSFRALLLLEKKWILNGMMASSSVVHSKVRKYCYLKWSCKRLKNRSLESNFGQKNLHFNCWLSSKHQQRRCFKC